jgi:hypothetical protein
MDGAPDSCIMGADVRAAAEVAGLAPDVRARLAGLVRVDDAFPDLEALAAVADPVSLDLAPGRWNALFGPLFSEFE